MERFDRSVLLVKHGDSIVTAQWIGIFRNPGQLCVLDKFQSILLQYIKA